MKSSLDCIPCFIRQSLEAARIVSADPVFHERVLRDILGWCTSIDLNQTPPVVARDIHRRLRQASGIADPYCDAKTRQNQLAADIEPAMRKRLETADAPLLMAVRLAIAANMIDLGVGGHLNEDDIITAINNALEQPLHGPEQLFLSHVRDANRILYLADNAGEIIFDRLLIEHLGPERVTLAVRGAPILNDVTMTDAVTVGLDKLVKIIDNGSGVPGTWLPDCSQEFRDHFYAADLIIAKGQGNYETLNDCDGNVFFLFKIKCPVVASHVQMPLGCHIISQTTRQQEQ